MSLLRRSWIEWLLIVVTLIGLGIDAYVHLHLASAYRLVRTAEVSQAGLFRLEAALAILAGLWLLIWPGLSAAAFAFLVAAGGVAAITFYYYVDPGKLGPIPDMYEPVWFADKTRSFDGEAAAAVASLVLFIVYWRRSGRAGR